MEKILCPSMMCADYGNLRGEVESLEAAGIDIFHIDVMDGRFVPNFAMGMQDVEFIAKAARKPVDAHLMIENPGDYVEKFAGLGVQIIYIHPQAGGHPARTLMKIADLGAKPGLVIDPETAVETVEPLLNLSSYVMVMTVNPGFAGQKYLDFVGNKIAALVERQKKYGYSLVIDGANSPGRIAEFSAKGVNGFVLGTSALFGKGLPYDAIVRELRAL